MMIYFAGPLFSQAEREFNASLAIRLEALGYEVFLPQRDGVEREKPEFRDLPADQKRKLLFELDTTKVIECDIFLFVLDGRVPDEGACVELGVAYTDKRFNKQSKLLLGLMTDSRAAFLGGRLNPMIGQALDRLFENQQHLLEFLKGQIHD